MPVAASREDLPTRIRRLDAPARHTTLVAIDGHGGAGKSDLDVPAEGLVIAEDVSSTRIELGDPWMPEEDRYVEEQRPHERAHVVVLGYDSQKTGL